MDPLSALVVPGLLGGLVVAACLWRAHRRSRTDRAVVPSGEQLLIDPINISRIPVSGVGGLGLVAMALVVAAFVPAIGVSMAVALAAGFVVAVLVIARRRHGPLPSGGQHLFRWP
jgi:hypothetical protein